MKQAPTVVPTKFEEVFRDYYAYVVNICMKAGIDPQDAEDSASYILAKFYERDMVSEYDPDYQTTYQGKAHGVKFPSYLSGFVLLYLRHHKDRQRIHQAREGLSLDTPLDDETTLADFLLSPITPHFTEELEKEELVAFIHRRLIQPDVRFRSNNTTPTLLFGLMVDQVNEYGQLNIPELAELHQVTERLAYSWVAKLRPYIREAVEAHG